MPILDHLSEEINDIAEFQSFHNAYAVEIAYGLNKVLPKGFRAKPHAQIGIREVDVRTDRSLSEMEQSELMSRYQPPSPSAMVNAIFPPELEVFVVDVRRRTQRTVGVVEIVSPGNKDRPESRNDFVAKCSNLLSQEVSVVMVDVLAIPRFNLHNLLLAALGMGADQMPENIDSPLYCTAYRKVFDAKGSPAVQLWAATLKVGDVLPELPLFITFEVAVPVNLETAYVRACEGLKIFEE